jgi:hypothetical protein
MKRIDPSPIEPLDYAHRPAPPDPPKGVRRGRRWLRIARLIYLLLCAVGLFFAVRFLLHYKQMIDDAIQFQKR